MLIVFWLLHRWRLRILTERVRNLLAERVSERERIARELHDSLLQGVQGLILLFQGVAVQMPSDSPLAAKIERAIDQAELLVSEGRESVRDLRAPIRNLPDALRGLSRDQPAHRGGYTVDVIGQERELQFLVCDEIFGIASEAVLNSFQHAYAQHVRVTLAYRTNFLHLTLIDDGKGMDQASDEVVDRGHWGLSGMKDRASRLRSKLVIQPHTPSGTEVRLSVPSAVAYREVTFVGAFTLRKLWSCFEWKA